MEETKRSRNHLKRTVRWLVLLTVCAAMFMTAGFQTFSSPPWTPGHPTYHLTLQSPHGRQLDAIAQTIRSGIR